MTKVLVLGGAGFIGLALVKRLQMLGYEITAVDRCWRESLQGVTCVTGDVFDADTLKGLMKHQDVVFHLVSTTVPAISNKDPIFDCESNVIGTLRVLEAMRENKVPQIIFASSGGTVYGIPKSLPILENAENDPISAYGIGKIAIEKYLKLYSYLHGIHTTVLRLSNPYGPGQIPEKGQGVIATFIKRALCGEQIEVWGDGSVVRDFVYIDDVIEAFILAEQAKHKCLVVNIGSEQGKSLLEILATVESKVECAVDVVFKDARACDVPRIILDIQKAKDVLGWTPQYSLKEGVAHFVSHMKAERRNN